MDVTAEEAQALQRVIWQHCESQLAQLTPDHWRLCGAHALAHDERVLARLLFWRRYMKAHLRGGRVPTAARMSLSWEKPG